MTGSPPARAVPAITRPNILVVMPDQMRRHACGFMGDPNVRTPVLDRLAEEGVLFDAMCATFPACVPFRFSFLTGEFAHTRAVPSLGYRLSPAERTIGEAIAAEGYTTAYIGKWHLYTLYGITGGRTLAQANRTPVPPAWRRGFHHWRGFELRNDFFDTWYFADDDPTPRRLEGYQTDALVDLALDHLRTRRGRSEPFFLILSVEPPHPPFVAPEADLRRVIERGPLQLRPNVDLDAIDFFPPEWREASNPAGAVGEGGDLQALFTANMQAYYAMIENLDRNLGRLLDGLVENRLAEDTIVLFLSDHGELGGSHGLLGKAEPWEESIGVPLVAWSANPGLVPGGRRVAAPVGTEDLFPTLVGLAGGIASPAGPALDLAPVIRGEATDVERDGVLLEFVAEVRPERAWFDATWRGVRTRRHKYTVHGGASGAEPWQLFDLGQDPFELTNLVADPAHAGTAAELHERLADLLERSADDYPLKPAFGARGCNLIDA